jgi:triosephosphate isomerase
LLDEREGGKTNEVLTRQIQGGFADISADDMAKIIVAYEPVWAIGTGKTATPEIAQDAHAHIRKEIAGMFGAEVAEKVRIQYGGSMKASNARELVAQKDSDGGLIGGAALKADSFAELVKEALGK